MRKQKSGRWYAVALMLLLLGAFFRMHGLARDQRLQPDEALYADWSRRVGVWGDWQLQGVPVDKPPLYFFVGGFFQRVLGDSEFTVRLPNAFASLLMLALLLPLAHRLTGKRAVAALVTLLMALSPLDIAHAVSGFHESQLGLWLVLSITLLLYQRWGGSGLAYGAAIATKSSALWMLPLMLAVGVSIENPRPRHVWAWFRGVLIFVIWITLWDALSGVGSFWTLGEQNYADLRLIRSDEVLPRAEKWLHWLRYALPHEILLIAGCIGLGYSLIRAHRTRRNMMIWAVSGFVLAYLGWHWLAALNVYERYLMPITPLLALLTGIGLGQLARTQTARIGTIGLVFLLGLSPAWTAANGRSPLASDNGQHTSIDELARVMNRDFAGEIFYEHWLGWELRYYLTAEPKVMLLYFDTADDLADYAWRELPEIPVARYFVAPKAEAAPWINTLRQRGLYTALIYDDGRYVIYQIDESPVH